MFNPNVRMKGLGNGRQNHQVNKRDEQFDTNTDFGSIHHSGDPGWNSTVNLSLVWIIRIRRLKSLIHIPREGPQNLLFSSLNSQSTMGHHVSLLVNAPKNNNTNDPIPLAMDREAWRLLAAGTPH